MTPLQSWILRKIPVFILARFVFYIMFVCLILWN
jgi:hypothetical protein